MKNIALAVVSLLAFVACSSNPSAQDAFEQLNTAECQKYHDCSPDLFALEYPKGISDCASQATSRDNPRSSAKDPCSQDEVNTCAADIEKMDCSTFVPFGPLPDS
jgi:hypothetical protein